MDSPKLGYYDCNTHLDQFPSPLSKLKEYQSVNFNCIVSLCDSVTSYRFLLDLIGDRFGEGIIIGLGIHPNKKYSLNEWESIIEFHNKHHMIPIGECGLDYSTNPVNPPTKQRYLLRKQLKIAEEHCKTIIVHCRNAFPDLMEIIAQFDIQNKIIHWFNGPETIIPGLLDIGFSFSYNSILFNPRYSKRISTIPLDKLNLESDSPFKVNNRVTLPEDFPKMADYIATLNNISRTIVNNQLEQNFSLLFPDFKKIL